MGDFPASSTPIQIFIFANRMFTNATLNQSTAAIFLIMSVMVAILDCLQPPLMKLVHLIDCYNDDFVAV